MRKRVLSALVVTMALMACGGRSATDAEVVNPRDTVEVPDYLSGEDSIAYIEDAITKSPISVEDLLRLAEVHGVEGDYLTTHRDSAASRLASRFLRMAELVNRKGDANDKLRWAEAVNVIVDTFRVAEPEVPADSVINEIERVVAINSSDTQMGLNYLSHVGAQVSYYRTIEAYRLWLKEVNDGLKGLMQEEYAAWHDFNEARFSLWDNVSYRQEWYSMRPMETQWYYDVIVANRRAELAIERDIILKGKAYQQKGKTVTGKEWEEWIAKNSVPEDQEFLNEEQIPSDSLVTVKVKNLRSTFARWMSARQAIAKALPKAQGDAYDHLTADMHSRLIGKLEWLVAWDCW